VTPDRAVEDLLRDLAPQVLGDLRVVQAVCIRCVDICGLTEFLLLGLRPTDVAPLPLQACDPL
jgi:hypothetical protein